MQRGLRRITSRSFSSLFEDAFQANNYALHRPDYPDDLFEKIYSYSSKNYGLKFDNAVDIGTGTGQVAFKLMQKFRSVIGLDSSEQQLEVARKAFQAFVPHQATGNFDVRFLRGTSENTNLPNQSTDLVTVAQALHWFNLELFYPEAHRVLRTKDTLAIWGYDKPLIEGNDPIHRRATAILHTAFDSEPVGPFWDERRRLVDNHLRGLEPRAPLFTQVERSDLVIRRTNVPLPAIAGYMRSWSAYTAYIKAKGVTVGGENDPAVHLLKNLEAAFSAKDVSVTLSFPVFLILATKV